MSCLYTTLPSATSIRLLRLHHGADGDPVSCSLEIIEDYLSAPPYHALSYCWGDQNDLVEVMNNGKPLAVTKNLHAALLRLRQRGQSGLVWVDALCINQEDISERNQQVSIMNMIYRHASQVLIWIGPATEHTKEVMVMMSKIAHSIHEECSSSVPIASWLLTMPAANNKEKVISGANAIKAADFPRANWLSFWGFYQAEWFFRVWVIQEVRQHQDTRLLCGNHEIEWNYVALSASWALLRPIHDYTAHWRRTYFPSYDAFTNSNFIWDRTLSTRRRAPFLALLHQTRLFHSTDPRDKVFAMLHHHVSQHVTDNYGQVVEKRLHPFGSQSTSATHLDFRADYSKSKYEVYREVALQSIQQYQSLEVLCYAWQEAHHSKSWPSWIPRWDTPNNHVVQVLLPFLYDAAGGSIPRFRLNSSLDSLSIMGLDVGTIVETGSVLDYETIINDQEIGVDSSRVKEGLLTILRLITQDRRKDETPGEMSAKRLLGNLSAEFANFSGSLASFLCGAGGEGTVYIPLATAWCNHCKQYIDCMRGETTPSHSYHCDICHYGDFDICTTCYNRGKRCLVPDHLLRKMNTTSLSLPVTTELVGVLRAHAMYAPDDHFQFRSNNSMFKTSQGRYGSAAGEIEVGDITVILFGSQVPFVLRKHGSIYRLVCDCYIDGLMDGEAMDMWKNGRLDLQEFEIR